MHSDPLALMATLAMDPKTEAALCVLLQCELARYVWSKRKAVEFFRRPGRHAAESCHWLG